MDRRFLIAGSLFGLLGVVIGAFATHGLAPMISEKALQSFETGVKYQMYHALLLLILGALPIFKVSQKTVIFYFFVIGILLFSGSIYGLSTNELSSFDFAKIALITPLGGMLLIIGWILLLLNSIKLKKK